MVSLQESVLQLKFNSSIISGLPHVWTITTGLVAIFSYLRISSSQQTSVIDIRRATNHNFIVANQKLGMDVDKFGNWSSQQVAPSSQGADIDVVQGIDPGLLQLPEQ